MDNDNSSTFWKRCSGVLAFLLLAAVGYIFVSGSRCSETAITSQEAPPELVQAPSPREPLPQPTPAPPLADIATPSSSGTPKLDLELEDVRIAMKEEFRSNIHIRFGAFISANNLSPEDAERMKDTMASSSSNLNEARFEINRAIGEGRQPPFSMREVMQRTRAEEEAALRATLGDETYSKFVDYTQTALLREIPHQLAARLYHTDSPLDAATADMIVDVIGKDSQGNPVRLPGAVDWAAARATLADKLSPTQLRELDDYIRGQNAKVVRGEVFSGTPSR